MKISIALTIDNLKARGRSILEKKYRAKGGGEVDFNCTERLSTTVFPDQGKALVNLVS